MTGVRAVGRMPWAAIATGLVLAGCGSAAAPSAQPSHEASRRGPAIAPNASAVPNGTQRCTEVYCVPQAVPRGRANGSASKARVVPNGAQRCTEVYCVPQTGPRAYPATIAATG